VASIVKSLSSYPGTVNYARLRCVPRPDRQGCVHAMADEETAVCGRKRDNDSQEWVPVEEPLEHEICYACWCLMRGQK